ncbi:MAG: hypothetical protein ACYTBZ_26810 [Planctomycetota bacterium]|jgi:hypothetical protein
MPLQQQSGLQSSKGGLQGLADVVKLYQLTKAAKRKEEMEERKLRLDESLAQQNYDFAVDKMDLERKKLGLDIRTEKRLRGSEEFGRQMDLKKLGLDERQEERLRRQGRFDRRTQRQERTQAEELFPLRKDLLESQIADLKAQTGVVGKPPPKLPEEVEEIRARTDKLKAEIPHVGKPTPKTPEEVEKLKEETRKLKLENDRALKAKYSGEQLSAVTSLRKEFNALSGEYIKIRDFYSRMVILSGNPSAAGDLGIIFGYMKMLDPPSVVREGEQATAANAAGVPARIRNLYNKIITGERLAPTQRQDFMEQAERLYRAQSTMQQLNIDNFSRYATEGGLDSRDVITPIYDFPPFQSPPGTDIDDLSVEEISALSPEQLREIEKTGGKLITPDLRPKPDSLQQSGVRLK